MAHSSRLWAMEPVGRYSTLLLLLHPFNGHFSRTTWVSQYQKGKPVWIKMRQQMMWFRDAMASAGPYANNLHLALARWPHQHLITQFLHAGFSSLCPTNSVKTLKATRWIFCPFGLKTPIYAPKIGVLGVCDPKMGAISMKPQKAHPCASPRRLSHQAWKSVDGSDL